MAGPFDLYTNLPELSWRGIVAPCIECPFDCSQDLAPRRYPYVDGEAHDPTGRGPYTVKAKVVFSNTIDQAAFPGKLRDFLNALEKRGSDTLVHPILGQFEAVVATWGAEVNAQERGAIVLNVTWVEDLFDPAAPQVILILGNIPAGSYATAGGSAMTSLGLSVPSSLGAASFSAAVTNLESLEVGSLEYERACKRIGGAADAVVIDANRLTAPEAWVAVDIFEALAVNMLDRVNESQAKRMRGTAQVTLTAPTSLDAFAISVGNKLEEVLALNASRITSPLVPKGASLTYYA